MGTSTKQNPKSLCKSNEFDGFVKLQRTPHRNDSDFFCVFLTVNKYTLVGITRKIPKFYGKIETTSFTFYSNAFLGGCPLSYLINANFFFQPFLN